MKVAILHSHLKERGGAEKRFLETAKFFSKNGVQMVVLEPNSSLLKSHDSCEVYALHNLLSAASSWLTIYLGWVVWIVRRACFRSVSIVRRENCHIILSPNNTVPNLLPAYFAHLSTRRRLCVITHHIDILSENANQSFREIFAMYNKVGYSASTSFLKSLAFFAMIKVLKKADTLVAVSNFTAKTLVKYGISENKIFVSGNSVDLEYIDNIDVSKERRYDAVFVGRIAKEKGVFDLLKTWRTIAKEKKSAKLLIVGSGPETERIKFLVKDTGLEGNVVLCGRVDDAEMYSSMKSAKVFVFPSRFEGWGLAVAEALACGLPVVCYDIPALREVFGGCESVFLVPVGDVEKFSSTVLKILSIKEKQRRKLAEISKTYSTRFVWSEVAAKDSEAIGK